MSEIHPRDETPEYRDEIHSQLTKLIKRHVSLRGTTYDTLFMFPDALQSSVRVLSFTGRSGVDMDLSVAATIYADTGRCIGVGVSKLHESRVLGKTTDYQSINNGPFKRTDDSGVTKEFHPEEQPQDNAIIGALMSIVGSSAILATREQNILDGVDGFPITAQEASELIEEITYGTPRPNHQEEYRSK